MDSTALFCVVFGALIAATRGPLLLWPDATLEIYRQVASRPPLLRVLGGVLLALGSWLLQLWFDPPALHNLLQLLGWLSAATGLCLLILPRALQAIILPVLEFLAQRLSRTVFRGFGALALVIAAALVAFGLSAA